MTSPATWRRRVALGGVIALAIALGSWGVVAFRDFAVAGDGGALDVPPPVMDLPVTAITVGVPDTMLGASGALRYRTLTPAEAIKVPRFIEVLGEPAIHRAAVHRVPHPALGTFSYIVLRPFADKRGEVLNGYRLGRWPAERWIMARNYFNPDGFIEVTEANAATPLTPHFTLGEFVTHDQRGTWPKYVLVEEKLLDKVELVLQELNRVGIPTRKVVVLSGFRAPYYNERGTGEGMARASRHQYGDAVDLIIDDNGDGRMDDLNRDGRLDLGDTGPVGRAIAAVERAHPQLRGGLGTYAAMGASGPFVHIDVRGTSARWERGRRP